MPVKVILPSALRQFTEGQDTVELEGGSVGQVLQALAEGFPRLKPHLFAEDGQLRNFVNVFVNDANIRDRDNEQTPLEAGDEITTVPAIAGG